MFGAFLGLALLKLGNPVVLDSQIPGPQKLDEWWSFPWPPRWSSVILLILGLPGLAFAVFSGRRWVGHRILWMLPVLWLLWQFVAASQTIDPSLTSVTLWHFVAVVLSYFLGGLCLARERPLKFALAGILAAFVVCTVQAAQQKWIEFPAEREFLASNEREGWTNLPPALVDDLRQQQVIIRTNGVDIANPVIVRKYERGRVFGTLVYPNALAGAVLLLFPIALTLLLVVGQAFRPMLRFTSVGLLILLGIGSLYWTGSKSGWLVAIAMVGLWLLRLRRPSGFKWAAVAAIALVGVGAFALRFQGYFAAGATSVGARFDYWNAAAKTAAASPLVGTGPGTFQRAYEQIKPPEAEMARLAHNDYLEQFCDSGFPGGVIYVAWIASILVVVGRRVWRSGKTLEFALFLGIGGWFAQGLSEFSLYIPALALTAFAFAGALANQPRQPVSSRS